ncbi:VG15 protein [Nocardia concava]|uniref:VG15 protein n=1 Tax=Nocardia concava TaxID=257281 RepID=UPI000687FBA0|nr:hypothetical protein [Nocardia concava]
MATAAQVAEFRSTNQAVVDLALQQLAEFLATEPSVTQLQAFWPEFVATFGRITATTAADWYDELRADAAVRPGYTAAVAEPVGAEQALGTLAWATADRTVVESPGPGAGPEAAAVVRQVPATAEQISARLTNATQRLVLQPGRATISAAAAHDPAKARWARVPSGKTCAFCLVLASRGAVYATKATAGGMHKFHDDCNCTPTPVWRNSPYPEGYEPDTLMHQYNAARSAADGYDLKSILSALRTQQSIA